MKTYNQFISETQSKTLDEGIGRFITSLARGTRGAGRSLGNQWRRPERAADIVKGAYGLKRAYDQSGWPGSKKEDEFGFYTGLATAIPGKIGYAGLVTDLIRRYKDDQRRKEEEKLEKQRMRED